MIWFEGTRQTGKVLSTRYENDNSPEDIKSIFTIKPNSLHHRLAYAMVFETIALKTLP